MVEKNTAPRREASGPEARAQLRAQAMNFLGQTVSVSIDRPLGSRHPSWQDLVYPVNYGFVPHVPGGDGEELDAYLLGVDVPLTEYTGRVIGVVCRENDGEDKLVVAPEGVILTQNEIAEQVYFQERYFKSTVEGLCQRSCGAVLFRRDPEGLRFLCLYQQRSQTYSVPKGHMEAFETEEQTVKREILEETGLSVELIPDFRETIGYGLPGGKQKTVVLFLGECAEEPAIDGTEIGAAAWLSAREAKSVLPPWYHAVIEKAVQFVGKTR